MGEQNLFVTCLPVKWAEHFSLFFLPLDFKKNPGDSVKKLLWNVFGKINFCVSPPPINHRNELNWPINCSHIESQIKD